MYAIDDDFMLRFPEPRDVEALYAFKNDPEMAELLGGFTRGYSRADIAGWVDFHHNAKDEVLWVVTTREDACVGHVGLYKIDHRVGQAEFAIILGKHAIWGRGLGTKLTRFAVEYAFNQLNLRRLYLDVLSINPRAQRVYEKLGFVVEGRRRQAQFKSGKYVDVIEMALLRAEYRGAAS